MRKNRPTGYFGTVNRRLNGDNVQRQKLNKIEVYIVKLIHNLPFLIFQSLGRARALNDPLLRASAPPREKVDLCQICMHNLQGSAKRSADFIKQQPGRARQKS